MRTLLIIVVLFATLLAVQAQLPRRYYRPRPTIGSRANDGRYRPSDDGRYRPSGEGKYRGKDDGRYRPVQDGKYRSGSEGKYTHIDVRGGQYEGDGGRYSGIVDKYQGGGGQYRGGESGQYAGNEEGKYIGDESGQYKGDGGQYKGDGSGQYKGSSSDSGSSRFGTGLKQFASVSSDITSAARPSIQGKGTAEGGSGWRIIRNINAVEQDGYHYL